MMRKLVLLGFGALAIIIGRKNLERLFIFGLKSLKIDLYPHAIIQKGFTSWENYDITGEKKTLLLLKSILPTQCVCFDIGANDGSYSLMLHEIFPKAKIHAFEPFPSTYEIAVSKINSLTQIELIKAAVGDKEGKLKLYNDISSPNSQISSAFPDGLKDFYHSNQLFETEVNLITLDIYCKQKQITEIDFLKIDVEGFELMVLKGAKELIADNKIKFIQFEFNDFNISSKTFLKDFYTVLPDFKFYRITKSGLNALGNYNTANEIFRFQNILAVHQEFADERFS